MPEPRLALHPTSIVPILVRSVQELTDMVKTLKIEIAALRGH